jgi:hypothetical protein
MQVLIPQHLPPSPTHNYHGKGTAKTMSFLRNKVLVQYPFYYHYFRVVADGSTSNISLVCEQMGCAQFQPISASGPSPVRLAN